jgi:hypothetical protein
MSLTRTETAMDKLMTAYKITVGVILTVFISSQYLMSMPDVGIYVQFYYTVFVAIASIMAAIACVKAAELIGVSIRRVQQKLN